MGIAAHRSFSHLCLRTVVEVESRQARDRYIFRMCGPRSMRARSVSPDNVRKPVRGARPFFGTSLALFGEITATNGTIDQSNFNNYQLTRMNPRSAARPMCRL